MGDLEFKKSGDLSGFDVDVHPELEVSGFDIIVNDSKVEDDVNDNDISTGNEIIINDNLCVSGERDENGHLKIDLDNYVFDNSPRHVGPSTKKARRKFEKNKMSNKRKRF